MRQSFSFSPSQTPVASGHDHHLGLINMPNNMTEWLNEIVHSTTPSNDVVPNTELLDNARSLADESPAKTIEVGWVDTLSEDEVCTLFQRLNAISPGEIQNTHALATVLRRLIIRASERSNDAHQTTHLNTISSAIESMYCNWQPLAEQRHLLLVYLAWSGHRIAWKTFASLIATDPPKEVTAVIESFVPLWKRGSGDYEALFPELVDAVQHLSTAAVVLDFCNFVAKEGRLKNHPAIGREAALVVLLGKLVERLEKFEEASLQSGVADLDTAKTVSESIALAISLAHTMTSTNCREASGKLYRMMELRHRRLRVEAAYALAFFEEQAGVDTLTKMAEEPFVRRRVVAYATELGVVDKIDEQHRSPAALAESELVAHLNEPQCFGIPPQSCELVDQRSLYWPGYDDAVTCYLFRFLYPFPQGDLANIGIVGPVTRCVAADLTELSVDDAYAVFAGLDVQHEDLRRWELRDLPAALEVEVSQSVRWLEQEGYTDVSPEFVVSCFGVPWVVATARKAGQLGRVVAEKDKVDFVAAGSPQRPIDANTAYSLVLGRNLLNEFNDV